MNTKTSQKVIIKLSEEEESVHDLRSVSFSERINQKFGDKIHFSESSNVDFFDNSFIEVESNQFLHSLNLAYSKHFAFKLSPDTLWMLIIQGVSNFIQLFPDENREILVAHELTKEIVVREDALLFNPSLWNTIPSRFIEKVKAETGSKSGLINILTERFSTSQNAESNAFKIATLDVYSSYFEYTVISMCHIPRIHLGGSYHDWQVFEDRLTQISDGLKLAWWIDHLLPIIKEIKSSIQGNINKAFWQSIYKMHNLSGGPFINGWIINFFPFIQELSGVGNSDHKPSWQVIAEKLLPGHQRKKLFGINPYLGKNEQASGLTSSSFHEGVSIANVRWKQPNGEKHMEMMSGFLGLAIDQENNCIHPGIGWLIREKRGTDTNTI